MSFQECFKQWKQSLIRVSDVNQFDENRTQFDTKGENVYKKAGQEQLKQKGVDANLVDDIIKDELKLFSQSKPEGNENTKDKKERDQDHKPEERRGWFSSLPTRRQRTKKPKRRRSHRAGIRKQTRCRAAEPECSPRRHGRPRTVSARGTVRSSD